MDGTFFGATTYGGTSNLGTIFRIDPSGTNYQVIHTFEADLQHPANPAAALVQDTNGNLYGTSSNGGNYEGGTVFSLQPDGAEFHLLHSFSPIPNFGPGGLVMGSDDNLYGAFASGSSGAATIFRMATDGTGFTVIKTLNQPLVGLWATLSQGKDGTLFGNCARFVNGSGFAFRVNTDGTHFEILHIFGSNIGDAGYPKGALLPGIDGALYGTAFTGGILNSGAVFRLPPTPLKLSITTIADTGFQISSAAGVGSTYALQASTNLFDWESLRTISNAPSVIQFFDAKTSTNSRRFYRVAHLP